MAADATMPPHTSSNASVCHICRHMQICRYMPALGTNWTIAACQPEIWTADANMPPHARYAGTSQYQLWANAGCLRMPEYARYAGTCQSAASCYLWTQIGQQLDASLCEIWRQMPLCRHMPARMPQYARYAGTCQSAATCQLWAQIGR